MNILITGITGYIGSRLAPRLLRDGHAIRGLSQRRFQSDFAGRVGEQTIVARKTRTAEAESGPQILMPDSRVSADRIKNHVDVRFWITLTLEAIAKRISPDQRQNIDRLILQATPHL